VFLVLITTAVNARNNEMTAICGLREEWHHPCGAGAAGMAEYLPAGVVV